MKETAINIVYSTDKKFVLYTMTSLTSLLKHLSIQHRVNAYIMIDFPVEEFESDAVVKSIRRQFLNCRLIPVQIDRNRIPQNGNLLSHITYMTYVRLFVSDMLPDVDNALYLDGDTYINDDIFKLWDYAQNHISTYKLMAIPNVENEYEFNGIVNPEIGERVFNAGVLFLNFKSLRMGCDGEKLLQLMDELPSDHNNDQVVLNVYFRNNNWGQLPLKWNVHHKFFIEPYRKLHLDKVQKMELVSHPGIVHFTSALKPWSPNWYVAGNPYMKSYQDILTKLSFGYQRNAPSISDRINLTLRKLKARI